MSDLLHAGRPLSRAEAYRLRRPCERVVRYQSHEDACPHRQPFAAHGDAGSGSCRCRRPRFHYALQLA